MQDRRALIVGIDHYQLPGNDLQSAVADARAIRELLSKNADGTPNYSCRLLDDTMEDGAPITRSRLRSALSELFHHFKGEVLLYFSGHGVISPVGGYLATHDAEPDDWGIPMQEVVDLACSSSVRDILLFVDCCHGGDIANPSVLQTRSGKDPLAIVREDMTVIAASHAEQASVEAGGHGLFTAAVLDALDGGGADHMGWVTAPSIYAYVERRFGAWDQRPVYKSHATHLTVVRKCAPLIERARLAEITNYFPTPDFQFALDPEFEPEDEFGNVHESVNQSKVAIAHLFKEYRDSGLLKPSIPGEQLFWTARRNHTVELTPRGQEYWRLVRMNRI